MATEVLRAGKADECYRAMSGGCLCMYVRALKGKRLELSTPNGTRKLIGLLYGSGSARNDPEVKR